MEQLPGDFEDGMINLRPYLARMLIIGVLLLATGFTPVSEKSTIPEYQVKAVFLFNFSQFVKWPDTAFASSNAPFQIAVVGHDPFGDYLDETVKGEMIDHHPFEIKRYDNPEEINRCQILFIAEKDKDKISNILERLGGRSILTVADVSGFAEMGGMIEFVEHESKIKLRINQDPAKKASLEISAKLLRLAEIVSVEQSHQP